MYNKSQLSRDKKNARKQVAMPNPFGKDVDYVSEKGYRDDSEFKDRPYIDINTPNGLIDMSATGTPLLANGRYLAPYSGLHQFDATTVREVPLAEDGGEYMDLTDEEIEQYRAGGYVVDELPKAQVGRMQGTKFYGDYYSYPTREDSLYNKIDNKWYVKNLNTKGTWFEINDPKRIANLEKNAKKMSQFELDRWGAESGFGETYMDTKYIQKMSTGKYTPENAAKEALFDNEFYVEPDKFTNYGIDQTVNKHNAALNFHKGWTTSPIYKEMLKKSSPQEWQELNKLRQQNLNDLTSGASGYGIFSQPENESGTAGSSETSSGFINYYPASENVSDISAHEMSHSIDRNRVLPNNEYSARLIPLSNIDYIESVTPKSFFDTPGYKNLNESDKQYYKENPQEAEYQKEWINYVSDPTETRARLNAIRAISKESGIYDPYTEKVTPEIYNLIKTKKFNEGEKSGFDPLNQLKDLYTDEQIMHMLNTISKNDNQSTDINQARSGGVYSQDIPYPPKHNPANSFAVNDPRSMQRGGVKPYVTSDINDFRLRQAAYNDSLWLYNRNRAMIPFHAPVRYSNFYGRGASFLQPYTTRITSSPTDRYTRIKDDYDFDENGNTINRRNYYYNPAAIAYPQDRSPYFGPGIPANRPIRYDTRESRWKPYIVNNPFTGENSQYYRPWETSKDDIVSTTTRARFKKPVQPVQFKKPDSTKPTTSGKPVSSTKPQSSQSSQNQKAKMVQVNYPTSNSSKINRIDENGKTVTEKVYYDFPENIDKSLSFTPPPITDIDYPPIEGDVQSTNPDPWNDVEPQKVYPKTTVPEFTTTKRFDSKTGKWVEEPFVNTTSPEYQYHLQREEYKKKNSPNLSPEQKKRKARTLNLEEEYGNKYSSFQDGGIKTLPEVTVTPAGYKGPTNLDPILANALLNTPQVQQNIALAKGKGPTVQGAKAIKSAKRAQDKAKFNEYANNQMLAKADWERRSSGAAQPVDEVWQLPLGLKALGTIGAIDIPYLGASVGELANLGAIGYGTTELPGTAKSWYDYGKGDVSLREALGKTLLNALDFLGARTGYNTGKNLIGTERGLMSIGKGFKPATLTREEAMANLSNPELYNALDKRTELISRDPAFALSKDAKEIGLRGIGENVDFKRLKQKVKKATDEENRLNELYEASGKKDKVLGNKLLNATSNKVRATYDADQFWKQRVADRLRLPIDLKSTNKVGEGAFTEVYPTTFDKNTLVKIGNVPKFETAETMQHIVNVGKELNNPRLGLPFKTVNFGEPYRGWNTDTQSEFFKPSRLYAQLMPRVPGRSGIPFNPSQQAVEEYIDMIKELEKRNIHLDYVNPQNTMYDDATDQFSIIDVNTTPYDDNYFLDIVNNANNWESELRKVYKDAMRAPNTASERFKAKADKTIRTPLNFNEEFEEGGTSEPPIKTLPEVTVRPKTLGHIVDNRPEYAKGYYDPWGVSDNTLENIVEIFDPTGMTSWDDVVRAEREFGKDSWQANLERLGAMPFLGKAAKTLKGLKGVPMTARQARSYNTTVKGLQGATILGRGSDAYQAADEFGTGGSYVDNQMTHFQDGGNTDPGNNALELHMFYDKDVYKQDGGDVKYLTQPEIDALRAKGYRIVEE